MRDESHVGLVDAHSERDGGDDDDALFTEEPLLIAATLFAREPCVVRQSLNTLLVQPGARLLYRLAREAVDNAGLAVVLVANDLEQCLTRLGARRDAVLDVGSVEARDELSRFAEPKPFYDLATRVDCGCCGQRDARNLGPAAPQLVELQVLGSEVMTPLRHAVRLVDREERQLGAVKQGCDLLQPLGSDVEQVEFARNQLLFNDAALVEVE